MICTPMLGLSFVSCSFFSIKNKEYLIGQHVNNICCLDVLVASLDSSDPSLCWK